MRDRLVRISDAIIEETLNDVGDASDERDVLREQLQSEMYVGTDEIIWDNWGATGVQLRYKTTSNGTWGTVSGAGDRNAERFPGTAGMDDPAFPKWAADYARRMMT